MFLFFAVKAVSRLYFNYFFDVKAFFALLIFLPGSRENVLIFLFFLPSYRLTGKKKLFT